MRKNLVAGRVEAAAAAILLMSVSAGCSGSSQKPAALGTSDSSTSATSASAAATTSAPTSSAPSSAASTEPTFKIPADYAVIIDPDTTGDPVKNAILADNAYFLKSYLEALASGDANDPLLHTYATPNALAAYWGRGVTSTHANGLTITGTERFYNRSVDIKSAVEANLSVCDDQSKAFNKVIATGKVQVTPVTDASYLLYRFNVHKNANGIWQVAATIAHQGDAAVKQECR